MAALYMGCQFEKLEYNFPKQKQTDGNYFTTNNQQHISRKEQEKRAKGMVEYNMSTSKTIGKGKKERNANELLCTPC